MSGTSDLCLSDLCLAPLPHDCHRCKKEIEKGAQRSTTRKFYTTPIRIIGTEIFMSGTSAADWHS